MSKKITQVNPVDQQTIDVYNARAGDYAAKFDGDKNLPALTRFMNALPKGASVVDLGCGPGIHSGVMAKAGLKVLATDASPEMVALAKNQIGVDVRQAEFGDLSGVGIFDAVWAHFSLLHSPRSDFPKHLMRIARALKPSGLLHLGLKTGTGEKRDYLGRFYTFYTPEELHQFLGDAGFEIIEETTGESAGLAGTVDPWIEILALLKS